ncbi:nineteen complex-related protein 2-domain-containing protein [Spinellus fusiger]|nr:nineteen complex-related protein 2-domain-containing protein [Spinellus fusiger]
MFKKGTRTKHIRRKIETSDDEQQDIQAETESLVKQTFIKSSTEKKKKDRKKSLGLSFEEEGGGEAFQIKKSKASQRLTHERLLHVDPMDVVEEKKETSLYTAELMASLRANTPKMPANLKTTETALSDDALLAEKFPNLMKATLGSVGIPDANAIHAAKKKRELLRKGVAVDSEKDQDYISLESSSENSRLIREEDDIGDDGEAEYEKYVGEKLNLTKTSAKKQEKERREGVREMIDVAEDEEEDDNLDRWERDLIKHGGVRSQYAHVERDPFKVPADYQPAQIPIAIALPTMADVFLKLETTSQQHTQTLEEAITHTAHAQQQWTHLHSSEEEMKKEIERCSQRYTYFQELKAYVNDLGEMLDAKFPDLIQLEEKAHALFLTKYEVVTERRWQDAMDDLSLFAILPKEPQPSESLDEFGRGREAWNSTNALHHRQQERQKRMSIMAIEDMDLAEQAMVSDDDMQESWITQREETLASLENQGIQDLLSDISSDFKPMRAVMDRFQAWKTDFYEDYSKAFGSLCLPGAFEFYVRCELVVWHPFSESIDFDSMAWHSVLSTYGVNDKEDADVELLNKVVEKVLVKRLTVLLDTLNTASTREIRHAVQTLEQVSYYVERQEKAYQDLLSAIVSCLERPLVRCADLLERTLLKENLTEVEMEAKSRFCYRQCKYLKTLALWKRHLPKDTLFMLGNRVMNGLLRPLLQPRLSQQDAEIERQGLEWLGRLQ